jgi:DNA-binding protein HU-beta
VEGKLVNKSQLIDALAARYEGNRKAAQQALETVLDTITREVARGEKVAITGFGSFEKRVREARWVRNPQTGARIKAKKTAVPKFTAGADLKNVVSGAKKLPKIAVAKATAPARKAAAPAKKAAPAKAAAPAKKAPAKKAPAKKAPAKKTTAKAAAPAKKTVTKKAAPAKKAAAKKAPAKKAPAKKAPAKKAPAKKA